MDNTLDPQRLQRHLPELLQQYVPEPAPPAGPAQVDSTPDASVRG